MRAFWPTFPPSLLFQAVATDALLLGTRVSLGRARWTHDGGSGANIFSVADGKRLAQEPVKHLTAFEVARSKRVAALAQETPLLAGIRLMPVFTPGRALLWGSICAAWLTGAAVATARSSLGITSTSDAGARLGEARAPVKASVQGAVGPWRGRLELAGGGGDGGDAARALGAKLRARLG